MGEYTLCWPLRMFVSGLVALGALHARFDDLCHTTLPAYQPSPVLNDNGLRIINRTLEMPALVI